jgi:hypothetical protein
MEFSHILKRINDGLPPNESMEEMEQLPSWNPNQKSKLIASIMDGMRNEGHCNGWEPLLMKLLQPSSLNKQHHEQLQQLVLDAKTKSWKSLLDAWRPKDEDLTATLHGIISLRLNGFAERSIPGNPIYSKPDLLDAIRGKLLQNDVELDRLAAICGKVSDKQWLLLASERLASIPTQDLPTGLDELGVDLLAHLVDRSSLPMLSRIFSCLSRLPVTDTTRRLARSLLITHANNCKPWLDELVNWTRHGSLAALSLLHRVLGVFGSTLPLDTHIEIDTRLVTLLNSSSIPQDVVCALDCLQVSLLTSNSTQPTPISYFLTILNRHLNSTNEEIRAKAQDCTWTMDAILRPRVHPIVVGQLSHSAVKSTALPVDSPSELSEKSPEVAESEESQEDEAMEVESVEIKPKDEPKQAIKHAPAVIFPQPKTKPMVQMRPEKHIVQPMSNGDDSDNSDFADIIVEMDE